ncbi:DUF423 domain-containing protein [Cognatitamlana onchidii]|uniref:DUF423 domain-containing protein n=1 Tax=Cognatitamlana onchidii TaxID=2562860 RepID=UPI0010A68702|nr:DUF423 domain-containing protein [Algibacter onchidii]
MINQDIIIITGALFGMLAVILSAFGAHGLKKRLSSEQLKNFETGVKYQMYHAIVLLLLGFNDINSSALYSCFTFGILFFSFSIYGLVISDTFSKKLRFLGPITPLGGLLLIIGWLLVIFEVL